MARADERGLREAIPPPPAPDPLDWLLCGTNRQNCFIRDRYKPPKKKVSVYELPDICRTGDILIFSTRDAGAKMIQKFTRSKWNHVAMVIRPAPSQTCALRKCRAPSIVRVLSPHRQMCRCVTTDVRPSGSWHTALVSLACNTVVPSPHSMASHACAAIWLSGAAASLCSQSWIGSSTTTSTAPSGSRCGSSTSQASTG